MQPAVNEGLATLAGSDHTPHWTAIALIFGVALLLNVLVVRFGAAPALRRVWRGLHVVAVGAWILGGWMAGLRLVAAPSLGETLARALLLLAGMGMALPVLRDLLAGLALVLEGRVRIGDDVRIDTFEGRVVGFGLRSLWLRDRDGTEATLPHRRLAASEIVRLNLGSRDAPCQFEVMVPPGVDHDAYSRRLLEAAMLSPYAAPGRRPEVFTVADALGGVRLRIRAYVFDRAYEERYRGDLLARAAPADARSRDA